MKHKKYKCKEQSGRPIPSNIQSNNLLYNDYKSEDTLVSTDRLRVTDPKHGRKDKLKYKSEAMEKKAAQSGYRRRKSRQRVCRRINAAIKEQI